MKDILGRIASEGSLVIAKATGRHSDGLHIGMMINNTSVRFRNGKVASYGEVFLITNPNEEELAIKNQILADVEKDRLSKEEEIQRKRSLKPIPKKELVIGQQYIVDNGDKLIFLGKGKVKKDIVYGNYNGDRRLYSEDDGYIFINEPYNVEGIGVNFYTFNRYKVRKTIPRFVGKTDLKLDIKENEFTITNYDEVKAKYNRYWSPNVFYLDFTLENN